MIGPLLFLIVINYLGGGLTCKHKMFADDLKLYMHKPNKMSEMGACRELQDDIDVLFDVSSSWGLKFAPSKCVHLRFKRGSAEDEGALYRLGNATITRVASHKDLGVVVDEDLRFHTHIRQIAGKAGGVASNLLKSTICRSASFMVTLFQSDVRPLLDFASQVWFTGFLSDVRLIESVQRRWTKQVDGCSEMPYNERLRVLNLFSIKGRLIRADLIQCYKIFNNLSPLAPSDLFILAPQAGTRGHLHKIFVMRSATEARRRFFSSRVVNMWNSLPESVVTSSSLSQFKAGLLACNQDAMYSY